MTTHVNKVNHVTRINRVAQDLGVDEDWLWNVANEMEIEDGAIWVDGVGEVASGVHRLQNRKPDRDSSGSTGKTPNCSDNQRPGEVDDGLHRRALRAHDDVARVQPSPAPLVVERGILIDGGAHPAPILELLPVAAGCQAERP